MIVSIENRLKMRNRSLEKRILYQEWRNLFFLHFKYPKEKIQNSLPKGLYVDDFNNEAYITIVPFLIKNLKIFNLPSFPFLSDFIEVNVRTYVYDDHGTPGVWFYSLDINSLIATITAQKLFFLPYKLAKLVSEKTDSIIRVSGYRNVDEAYMNFSFSLPKDLNNYEAGLESLDFFLLERYALFTVNADCLYIQKIHHSPYILSAVNLLNYESNLLEINHFSKDQAILEKIHFCRSLNVDFFPLRRRQFNVRNV